MADDKLRIVASVDDQFSKPLEKLRGELANTARVPGLDDLRKRFSDIEGTITRLRQTGAQLNSVGGIGGMLGLGSLTGIASVAGLAASMRDLARTQVEMRHFSRETAIAAGQLKELQELGKRFQIAPEATTGALNSFADQMYDIRHGIGGMYGELRQKAPELAKDLRNSKDNVEALGHALGWLGKQGDTIEQKRWAEGLGLGPMTRLFTDGPKALQDAWRQIQASGIGKPNPELEKQSKALTDALNRFDTSVEMMKRTWAPGLLGEMANAVDKLSNSFGKFAEAYDKFRNGNPVDALKTIDEATDLGIGQRKNAPPSKPATPLDEQLDAQMRGQAAQSPAEKERADKIAAAEARLNKARDDLGYQQRRFPLKDEGAIKSLSEQIRQLNEELRKLRSDGATRQGVSFDGTGAGGLGGLIQKASLRFPGGLGSGGGGYRPGGAEFGPEGSYGSGGQAFKRLHGGADDLGDGIRGRPFGMGGATRGEPDDIRGRPFRKGGAARGEPGGKKGPAGIPYNATDLKGAVGIDDAQWSAYREGLTDIEGKRYEQVGGAGGRYSGRYQFGPREIAETARQLGEAPPSRAHFLGDKAMQERFMERYTLEHHKFLQRNSAAYRGMSPEKKLEILGYAHNQGAGRGSGRVVGALGYLESGREGRDGFGTRGTAYFRTIRRRLAEAAERHRAHAEAHQEKPGEARGAGRRPDILADPNDERRRGDDGPRQIRPWTKAPADANMLKRAREAGVVGGVGGRGGQQGHINGTIRLQGFPAGTKAEFNGGGIVKEVKLNRGSAMTSTEA